MEVVLMFCVERYEDFHDRVPRVGSLCNEPVTADVTREFTGFADPGELDSVRRSIGRNYRAVEDSRVLGESRDHDLDVYLCQLLRRHTGAAVRQHFEPYTEAFGIELLIHSWFGGAPKIE